MEIYKIVKRDEFVGIRLFVINSLSSPDIALQ